MPEPQPTGYPFDTSYGWGGTRGPSDQAPGPEGSTTIQFPQPQAGYEHQPAPEYPRPTYQALPSHQPSSTQWSSAPGGDASVLEKSRARPDDSVTAVPASQSAAAPNTNQQQEGDEHGDGPQLETWLQHGRPRRDRNGISNFSEIASGQTYM
ncbi:hypothetical protein FS837_007464 [Tulasnella sp. UAMH 9824]|nr:hypothetical protein FS837_007464 [Tulasnella sp. UAMH 9824]